MVTTKAIEKARALLSKARRKYIDQAIGNPRERALYGNLMAAIRAYEDAKDAVRRVENVPRVER